MGAVGSDSSCTCSLFYQLSDQILGFSPTKGEQRLVRVNTEIVADVAAQSQSLSTASFAMHSAGPLTMSRLGVSKIELGGCP